jgi:predicted aspartyl protease
VGEPAVNRPTTGASEASPPAAAAATATTVATRPSAAAPGAARGTPIVFRRFGDEEFSFPLARARLAGIDTFVIIDTGATHHVLARWLVDRAGLPSRPSSISAQGHVGEKLAPRDVQRPPLSVEQWGPIDADVVLTLPLPAVFEKLGIGGVLSPQALASAARPVVLDFPRLRLTEVTADHTLGSDRGRSLGAGAAAVSRSDLSRRVPAARPLLRRARKGEASYTAGGRQRALRVSAVRLRVGAIEQRLDLDLAAASPQGSCARDGNVGMDVLRRCVLLLAPQRFEGRCAAAGH